MLSGLLGLGRSMCHLITNLFLALPSHCCANPCYIAELSSRKGMLLMDLWFIATGYEKLSSCGIKSLLLLSMKK